MRTRLPFIRSAAFVCAAVSAAILVLFTSCESGGDDSVAAGSSTIDGYVTSFTTAGAVFLPATPPSGFQRLLEGLSDLIVPSAQAGMGGVGVRVMGTQLQTTTADDGYFIMSGVPAGHHTMAFTFNGAEAMMEVDVSENSTLTLHEVRCVPGSATAGHMQMTQHMSPSATTNMPMNGSGGAMHNNVP
jgi:hypothetical protein